MYKLDIIDFENQTFESHSVANIQEGNTLAVELNNFNYNFLPFVREKANLYVANSHTRRFIIRRA